MSKIQIPNPEAVKRSLANVDKRLKAAIKQINLEAAKHTKNGDYTSADKWISVAKFVLDYQSRLNAFIDEWQTLTKTSKISGNSNKRDSISESKRIPQWRFYSPLLESLSEVGGQAHIKDLLPRVEMKIKRELKEKDLELNKNGVPKWQAVAMGLSSRLRRYGWVQIASDKKLILTDKGATVIKNDSFYDKNT